MDMKVSKIISDAEYFNARIDAIPMSEVERVRAKAQLARAEAVADLLADIFHAAERGLKNLTDHGLHRPTHSHG